MDESTRANFEQLGLDGNYLDVVVCDASRPPWAREGVFRVL